MSLRRWWPPIAWAAFILIVSSTPASDLPKVSLSDKIEHAGVYFILAALVVRAMKQTPAVREMALLTVGLAAFGAVDEWHQGFIPGRFPDAADAVADAAGSAAGIVAASALRNALSRRAVKTSA